MTTHSAAYMPVPCDAVLCTHVMFRHQGPDPLYAGQRRGALAVALAAKAAAAAATAAQEAATADLTAAPVATAAATAEALGSGDGITAGIGIYDPAQPRLGRGLGDYVQCTHAGAAQRMHNVTNITTCYAMPMAMHACEFKPVIPPTQVAFGVQSGMTPTQCAYGIFRSTGIASPSNFAPWGQGKCCPFFCGLPDRVSGGFHRSAQTGCCPS